MVNDSANDIFLHCEKYQTRQNRILDFDFVACLLTFFCTKRNCPFDCCDCCCSTAVAAVEHFDFGGGGSNFVDGTGSLSGNNSCWNGDCPFHSDP